MAGKRVITLEIEVVEGQNSSQILEELRNELNGASAAAASTGEAFGTFIGGVAVTAVLALSAALVGGLSAVIAYSKELELARVPFKNLTGDMNSAREVLDDLRKLSNDDGLDFSYVQDAAKDFLRLSVTGKDAVKILQDIADVSAGIGGDGATNKALESITTDVIKAGKFTLEAFNKIQSAGVSADKIFKSLETQTGKTRTELLYLLRDGKITSDIFIQSFDNLAKVNFGDAAKAQTNTLTGAVTQIQAVILDASQKAFEPYYDQIFKFAQQLRDKIKGAKDFEEIGVVMAQEIGRGLITNIIAVYKEAYRQGNLTAEDIKHPATKPTSFLGGLRNGINESILEAITGKKIFVIGRDENKPLGLSDSVGSDKITTPTPFNSDAFFKQLELQKTQLTQYFQARQDIISTATKLESAILNSHLRLTNDDELNFISQNYEAKQRSLNEQISLQKTFFDQQIALSNGDAKEITKLTLEKNKTLRGLYTDLAVNSYDTVRQYAELERKVLEQKRQTAIQSAQLQSRELTQILDKQTFDINRNINFGRNVESNFDQLKSLTAKNYLDIAQTIKQSYAIQLQNERLTSGEKINIQKQEFLELKALAEKNRETLLQIDDQRYQAQIAKLERFSEQQRAVTQSALDGISAVLTSFSANKNQQGIITKFITDQFLVFDDVDKEIRQVKAKFDASRAILDSIGSQTERSPIGQRAGLKDQFEEQSKVVEAYRRDLNSLENATGLTKQIFDLQRLGIQLDSTNVQIDDFDKAEKALLETLQSYRRFQLDQQKNNLTAQKSIAIDKGDILGANNLQNQIDQINLSLKNLDFTDAQEKAAQFRRSINGINAEFEKLSRRDLRTVLGIQDETRKTIGEERNQQLRTQIALEYRLANSPLINKEEIEVARLEKLLDLRHQETDAIIRINAAKLELENKGIFSQNQSDAIFLEGLNQRVKSLNETVADFKLGIADGVLSPIDGFFGKINSKIEKLPSGIKEIASAFNNLFRDIIKQSLNKFIRRLFGLDSASSNQSQSSGGFSLANIFGSIFGGNRSSSGGGVSVGGFGGGTFNFPGGNGAGTNIGGLPFNPGHPELLNIIGLRGDRSSSGGGFNLSKLFGKGGIFGEKGFGFNSGTISGIGGFASVAGGLIPGTGGSVLSGVGAGIGAAGSLGSILGISALGGPIGLLIGGAIGGTIALISALFGKSKQRKRDEATRNQATLDAFGEIDKLKAQVESNRRNLTPFDGTGILNSADQIRAQYLQTANSLKDKKTRNRALADVSRVDSKIAELRALITSANSQISAAGDIDRRLAPTVRLGAFADGGLIPGNYDRRDNKYIAVSGGELVLTPNHQNDIRRNFGDVFAATNIPNYPRRNFGKFADGGFVGSNINTLSNNGQLNITLNGNFRVILSKEESSRVVLDTLNSPDGAKVQINTFNEAKKLNRV